MKQLLIGLYLVFSAISIVAQDVNISDIEMLNLGDGRLFARERKDEKAVDGRVRIITGYTTEYIDAGFSKGYADGKWEYYKNNKLSESKNYVNGYLEGEKITYYPDGTIQEKNTLKNGKANGIYIRYSSNGKITYEKGMKDGMDDGPERSYDDNGKVVSETIYTNGKAEGKSFTYMNRNSTDAYLKTCYYKGGQLDGEYSEVYEGGVIKIKGKYVNGIKEGTWIANKKDGMPNPTEVFEKGKVMKRTTYYNDGKREMERNFNALGQLHGLETKWSYSDGSVKSEFNYVNGKQVGKQKRYMSSNLEDCYEISNYNEAGLKDGEYLESYVKNGKIKTKGQYANGKKTGTWVYGHSDGVLYLEEVFENDREVSSKRLK